MSTSLPALDAALSALPQQYRTRLVQTYSDLKAAYASRQFDACGLRAGKFCEIALRWLQHELTGTSIPFGTRIPGFTDECRKLEKLPKTSGSESFRVLVPRALDFAYTLRNKRDIGHVGGDVDANEVDAAAAVRVIDWCLSEIIRNVHPLSLEEAQELLDAIVERQVPQVWAIGGVKRVLNPTLTNAEQVLVLLYGEQETAVPIEDLASWIEVPRLSNFRLRVIEPMHKLRLIEYDRATQTVVLSPTGIGRAEAVLQRLDG
jgi:hypothetical protein